MSLQDAIEAEKVLIAGNAAGTVKTLEDVKRMCRSGATRITVGSITIAKRIGNTPAGSYGTYYFNPEAFESGNALGLNNMGLDDFLIVAPEMIRLAHEAGKKLIASVAGNSTQEIVTPVMACLKAGVDGVEINFGCPNVHDSGHRHAIFSYEPDLFSDALFAIKAALPWDWKRNNQKLGVKVSPVIERTIVVPLSNAIWQTDIIDEIVAVNTDPDHRFILPDGSDALAYRPPGSDEILHVGGQAGRPLKEIRRNAVRLWRKLQKTRTIIAVGGIFTGQDVFEAIMEEGANGFECATAYIENGERIFTDILEDYETQRENALGGALTV